MREFLEDLENNKLSWIKKYKRMFLVNYEKIIKDCFWDYDMNVDDLKNIIERNDEREMKKLFSKIIYNSQDKLQALQIFSHEQLKKFFSDFKITYNEKYISKHFLVLQSLLLDKKYSIKGLEWKKI